MSNLLRVAIVDSDDTTREAMQRELLSVADRAWLEADCSRYEVFPELVAQTRPDVALVAVDGDPTLALPLIQNLASSAHGTAVIAISGNSDGRFVLDLMRMGVRDVLSFPPRDGELAEVLARIVPPDPTEPNRPRVPTSSPRKVIAVAGARGGVGCTSIAINAACVLAADPANSVVVVDLDLYLGDVHMCLDLVPRSTLYQAIENIDQVDATWLKRAVSQHESKVHVLPRPDRLAEIPYIQPAHIGRIVTLLKRNFTHIILDLSKAYSPVDLAAMEVADDILLVMQLDMSNIYNVLRFIETMETDNPALVEKIRVVANRLGSEGSITVAKAQEVLKREVAFQVPNDTRTLQLSRDNGKPLSSYAPGSKVHLAIAAIANALGGKDRKTKTPASGGGSMLGKLFGRKG